MLSKYYPQSTFAQILLSILLFFLLTILIFYIKGIKTVNAVTSITGLLSSNLTNGFTSSTTAVTSLDSNGFTLGSTQIFNKNANNYVAWAWKEDVAAGFDMVTYTGTGGNTTVAHSLAATPEFMIIKRTDTTSNWAVWHKDLTSSTTQALYLNTTGGPQTDATLWNSTTSSATTIYLGASTTVNAAGGTYLAYVFTGKPGYSKFGSYKGNGAADGAFVYTGFKPKWILIKRADATAANWVMWDTERDTYNPAIAELIPNTTAAEAATADLDVLSNGFKARATTATFNANGAQYIYAAFAEYPFKEQFTPNGFSVGSSTRFDGTNTYLRKTFASDGDLYKYTFSIWAKRAEEAAVGALFGAGAGAGGGQYDALYLHTDNTARAISGDTSNNYDTTTTNNEFTDLSKWHHLVVSVDRTQDFNHSFYIDGILQTATSASLSNFLAANSPSSYTNTGGLEHRIGNAPKAGLGPFSGLLSNVYFIDGAATSADAFGAFDSNGIWRPKVFTGSFYGDNLKTLQAFLSNGFQFFSAAVVNTLSDTYIAWAWKEDVTAGFDIVQYTGNGSIRTIGHSLAATPTLMMFKRTDSTGDWVVYHEKILANKVLLLNSTAISAASTTVFNSATPTPTVFTLGTAPTVNANGASYIGYLFAEKNGYSKFGSYIGNGNADGAFVYTGFKPKYIMIKKSTTAVDSWHIFDTTRSTYNPTDTVLFANTTDIDTALANGMDINSNGFKLRTTDAGINTSGATYVYAAFAEYPFKEQHMPNGYAISTSTRFNGTNAVLTRTPSSDGDRTTWTTSFWMKRTKPGSTEGVLAVNQSGTIYTALRFTTDSLRALNSNGSINMEERTSNLFRDPSKWHHVVMSVDTTSATPTDRTKFFIDGIENTDLQTETTIAQSAQTTWNSAQLHRIGYDSGAGYFSGYLSDMYFVDGQALTASAFGQFDSNGIWHPKSYTGTYGTNGFHLDFANAADPGNDVSGNNNDFTNNNIATTDNVIDTPTNNFAVANSVNNFGTTLSQSNLLVTAGTGNLVRGSLGVSTGKYYWESTATAITGTYWTMGLCDEKNTVHTLPYNLRTTGCYGNEQAYYKTINGGALTAFDANGYDGATHTHMLAVDLDNDKIWFGLDGVWYDAGNPATNSNGYTISASQDGRTFMPVFGSGSATTLNFGQGGQSGLTYDAAAGGYFKYTPPTGFKALSTANMPATDSNLVKGSNWFDAVLYTGTGAVQSITSLNFQPDLVWIKDRTTANSHAIFDSVRSLYNGFYCYLSSNTNASSSCLTTANSFHLDFSDPTNPGKDVSGLGNHWTAVGFTATTSQNVSDTPTNNFATGNPLHPSTGTYSQGALQNTGVNIGNVSLSSGNWYWETTAMAANVKGGAIDTVNNGSSTVAIPSGSTYGFWLNASTGFLAYTTDGVSSTTLITSTSTALSPYAYGAANYFQFGQGATSSLVYNAAAGGYFKYTPPAGFKAISTNNMTVGSIPLGSSYFDTILYTGNGTGQSISGLSFEPNFVWIKDRTSANNHGLFGDGSAPIANSTAQIVWMEW
jgi:hypothetical protein